MLKSTMLNLKWVRYKPEFLKDPFLDHCYLLYILMISKHLLMFNVITYADDTTLMSTLGSSNSNQNQNSVEQNINDELNKLSGWLKVNKLSLNTKKSKFMIFKHLNKTIEPLSLKIENTNIEKVIFCFVRADDKRKSRVEISCPKNCQYMFKNNWNIK